MALLFSSIELTLQPILQLKQDKTILLLIISFVPQIFFSQTRISVASDASLQRSFKREQKFWAVGQDVVINWHFTQKSGTYAWASYYSNGNFINPLFAPAKSTATLPQQFFFRNKAQLRLVQISLGWRQYLVGTGDAETNWNLYAISGFGLVFGKATNTYLAAIDTSLYDPPSRPINGKGHFKRLTLDLGLGYEIPLGGEIYFYSEAKCWIPTTDYPSKYLFVNNNAPFVGMITAGVRILF